MCHIAHRPQDPGAQGAPGASGLMTPAPGGRGSEPVSEFTGSSTPPPIHPPSVLACIGGLVTLDAVLLAAGFLVGWVLRGLIPGVL